MNTLRDPIVALGWQGGKCEQWPLSARCITKKDVLVQVLASMIRYSCGPHVHVIRRWQGMHTASSEQIGLEMGFITEEQFAKSADRLEMSTYDAYLRSSARAPLA